MPETPTENKQQYPMILFLSMIILGISIAIWGDNTKDLIRYSFATVISLAGGLGATFLTGKITGGGKFGFINIKSASGGCAVWLIIFSTFFYFFSKKETNEVNKFFALTSIAAVDLKASFIDSTDSVIPISEGDLYKLINFIKVENSTFKIKLTFSKTEIKNYKAIKLSFGPIFCSKIGRIENNQRFFALNVKGWTPKPSGDGGYSYTVKRFYFKEETELDLPFII